MRDDNLRTFLPLIYASTGYREQPIIQIIDVKSGTLLRRQSTPLPRQSIASWISPDKIAFWTTNAVYHWQVDTDSPVRVFAFHSSTKQNVGAPSRTYYEVSVDGMWCIFGINGVVEAWNTSRQQTQILRGFIPALSQLRDQRTGENHNILVTFKRSEGDKLSSVEVYHLFLASVIRYD